MTTTAFVDGFRPLGGKDEHQIERSVVLGRNEQGEHPACGRVPDRPEGPLDKKLHELERPRDSFGLSDDTPDERLLHKRRCRPVESHGDIQGKRPGIVGRSESLGSLFHHHPDHVQCWNGSSSREPRRSASAIDNDNVPYV
jgi:hypothetical protein